jgi:uncharacterized protein YecE (DUF72 family)
MARRLYVGTSGWTYDDWAERFYPRDVKGSERLTFYATCFNAVEVNATFYRFPTETMIAAWNRRLSDEFHLVVKGHRSVTHLHKLVDCEERLTEFLSRVSQLVRLKVVLWQLPPSLHKDLDRLEHFLSQLPPKVRHAVEFRHVSWFDDEVAAVLTRYQAAFVAVSHPRLPDKIYATTDFLYVRFHGQGRELYRYNYSPEELARWASMVKPHLKSGAVYAFFNNDYEAHAPNNALQLRDLLAQA